MFTKLKRGTPGPDTNRFSPRLRLPPQGVARRPAGGTAPAPACSGASCPQAPRYTIFPESTPVAQAAEANGLVWRAPQHAGAERAEGVVQRALGYEYELGDVTTSKREHGEDTRLAKGETLFSGSRDGFQITADDPPAGSSDPLSDLELIVHPPLDDTKPANRGRVENTMTSMQDFVNELRGLYAQYKASTRSKFVSIPATDFDGDEGKYLHASSDNSFGAGVLQATAGLSLAALAQIRSGAASARAGEAAVSPELALHREKRDAQKRLAGPGGGGDTEVFGRALAAISGLKNSMGQLLKPEDQAALAGVISLIVAIPINAWSQSLSGGTIPYPKAVASQLMQRTDFATILQQLPFDAFYAVARFPHWTEMLIHIVNQSISPPPKKALTKASPIFPGKFQSPEIPTLSLSLGYWFEWLHGLGPMDLLTEKNYPEEVYGAKGKGQAAAVESLGGYGKKMDPGEDGQGPRPIFEFRSLGRVMPSELVEAGLAVWDYVIGAHHPS